MFTMKISELAQNLQSCVLLTATRVSLSKCGSDHFSARLRERASNPKWPTGHYMLWPPTLCLISAPTLLPPVALCPMSLLSCHTPSAHLPQGSCSCFLLCLERPSPAYPCCSFSKLLEVSAQIFFNEKGLPRPSL